MMKKLSFEDFKEVLRMYLMPDANYGGGIITNEYQEEVIEQFNMIAKIAYQMIRGVTASDKLEVFNKMPVDNGLTIEQAIVGLAKGYAFADDGDVDKVFKKTKPNMHVRYFKKWTSRQFASTIDRKEIRKVLVGNSSVEDMAELIVASLTQGDYHEKYEFTKELFKWGATTGNIITKVGNTVDLTQSNGYKEILKLIKNTIKGMTYVNDKYNKAGLKRRTPIEDIRIIAPYDLITAIDVDELAGVFNLEKAEIRNRIIEIDSDVKRVYIVDVNAVMLYTRLYMMTDQMNRQALYHNFWLTTERMYALSPLFDSAYIDYTDVATRSVNSDSETKK